MRIIISTIQNISRTHLRGVLHHHDHYFCRIFFVDKFQNRIYVFSRDFHVWWVGKRSINCSKKSLFWHLIKESESPIIIFLRNRVVFMVVTMGTLKSKCQERFSESICAVGHIFNAVFFINYAPFLRDFMVSVKTSCQQHFFTRIWQ